MLKLYPLFVREHKLAHDHCRFNNQLGKAEKTYSLNPSLAFPGKGVTQLPTVKKKKKKRAHSNGFLRLRKLVTIHTENLKNISTTKGRVGREFH